MPDRGAEHGVDPPMASRQLVTGTMGQAPVKRGGVPAERIEPDDRRQETGDTAVAGSDEAVGRGCRRCAWDR